jgi:hypothetical protein
VFAALLVAGAAATAAAGELWRSEDGKKAVSLGATLKATFVGARGPADDVLYPERSSASGLFRARLSLTAEWQSLADGEVAYEQRARLVSEDAGAGAGGGAVSGESRAFWRLRQWDWELDADDDGNWSWRQEIDRALIALHPGWGEVVVGRQAIGLGRGVLFGALDVFSPFAPAEADREWRRGVDAVRAEVRLSDTVSAEAILVGGESWDESALLGRLRGYLGSVDGELVIGKRGEDGMYALAASSTLGEAEVHAEVALFDLREPWPEDGPFDDDELVLKALVGGSYTFAVGEGLTLRAEYHYSGFGLEHIEEAALRLAEPGSEFRERLLRGDTQLLGQHAVGLQAGYPLNESWSTAALLLVSPADGSGLAAPSVTWNPREALGVVVSLYLPWGQDPRAGVLQSEHGGSPVSLYLQLTAYF